MTDTDKLAELARAAGGTNTKSMWTIEQFRDAADPQTILALLDSLRWTEEQLTEAEERAMQAVAPSPRATGKGANVTTNKEITDEAVERVERNANEEWKEIALATVFWVAEHYPLFTADRVWERLPADVATHERRAMGAVMRAAKYAGYASPTGRYEVCERAAGHQHPTRVWRSRIWKGG